MKGNKIMGILWLVIALCLTGIFLYKMSGKKNSKSFGISITGNEIVSEGKLVDTIVFNKSEIECLDVSLHSESLIVEEHSGDNIVVELYGTEDTVPDVSKYKNVLKIEEKDNKVKVTFGPRKVIIKLPAGYKALDADLNTLSGSMKLDKVSATTLDCSTSSGSFHMEDSSADTCDVKANSGSIKIANCILDDLDCNSTSGSITLKGSFEAVSARAMSGSIYADLDKPLTLDSSLQTTSGSISLNVPKDANMEIKYSVTSGTYRNKITETTGKKGRDSVGNNGPKVELQASSGSINVSN